jgi:hypothetical protein
MALGFTLNVFHGETAVYQSQNQGTYSSIVQILSIRLRGLCLLQLYLV